MELISQWLPHEFLRKIKLGYDYCKPPTVQRFHQWQRIKWNTKNLVYTAKIHNVWDWRPVNYCLGIHLHSTVNIRAFCDNH
jgi:hypothetical protein